MITNARASLMSMSFLFYLTGYYAVEAGHGEHAYDRARSARQLPGLLMIKNFVARLFGSKPVKNFVEGDGGTEEKKAATPLVDPLDPLARHRPSPFPERTPEAVTLNL